MKTFITLSIVTLLSTSSVIAAEFDQLVGDVDMFEDDISQEMMHEKLERNETQLQEESALFPGDGNEMEKGEVTDDPIRIIIDGVPLTLKDVPSSAWFARFVESAAQRGIVSGYKDQYGIPKGEYGPGDNVTIEQLAKIALEASGVDITACDGALKNGSAVGTWSEQYIACTEGLGWAVYSDGSVEITRPATRSEVVITILQAFLVPVSRGSGDVFKDVTVSTEFSGAIEKAAQDSMVSGFEDEFGILTGNFGPRTPVNRAETAKIIILAIEIYGL